MRQVTLAAFVLFSFTILASAAEDEDRELKFYSPKKVSRNPFGNPSLNTADAAGYFNVALSQGVIDKFQDREVPEDQRVNAEEVETLVLPAGSVVEMMAGCKGEGADCEIIYSGPFRLEEATLVYVVRKWGRPVGMIPSCSNPLIGSIPDRSVGPRGLQGLPGVVGREGKDGKNGRDGRDGVDGKDATCRYLGQSCWAGITETIMGGLLLGWGLCEWGVICEESPVAPPQEAKPPEEEHCPSGVCVVIGRASPTLYVPAFSPRNLYVARALLDFSPAPLSNMGKFGPFDILLGGRLGANPRGRVAISLRF